MKVSELMTTDVRNCWANEPLDRAAKLMWESDCGSLPVLDQNGRVVGMITDRDVCMAAYTQAELLARIPVSRAMSHELHSCRPDEDLDKVEKRMRAHQIRRLPVLDDEGHLQGVLSLADIAQRAAREAVRPPPARAAHARRDRPRPRAGTAFRARCPTTCR